MSFQDDEGGMVLDDDDGSEQNNTAGENGGEDDANDANGADDAAEQNESGDLSVTESIALLQPDRIIFYMKDHHADVVAKEFNDAVNRMTDFRARRQPFVKDFLLDADLYAEQLREQQQQKGDAAAGGDQTDGAGDDDDDEQAGGNTPGENATADGGSGANQKKKREGPKLDMRPFVEDPGSIITPFTDYKAVDKSTRLKYLRPELPLNDVKKAPWGGYQSPGSVRYAKMKLTELPLSSVPLKRATSKEIVYAWQRINDTVVLGHWTMIGAIVTVPGMCTVDFDSLPLIDAESKELSNLSSSVSEYTRANAGAAAVCVVPDCTDKSNAEFVHVMPLRITLGAFTKVTRLNLAHAKQKFAAPGGTPLTRNYDQQRVTDISKLLATSDAACKKYEAEGRDPSQVVLRLYTYRVFAPAAVRGAVDVLFKSVVDPEGKDKQANLKANLRFIQQFNNRTYVELTSALVLQTPEIGSEDVMRKILTTPILPTQAWAEIKNRHKEIMAEIKAEDLAATTGTVGKKRTKTHAAATAAAAVEKPETVEKLPAVEVIESAPTKETIATTLSSTATQQKVKKTKEAKTAAEFLNNHSDAVVSLPPKAIQETPAAPVKAEKEKKDKEPAKKKQTTTANAPPPPLSATPKATAVAAPAEVIERTEAQKFALQKLMDISGKISKLPDGNPNGLGPWHKAPLLVDGPDATDDQKRILAQTVQTLRYVGLPQLLAEQAHREREAEEAQRAKKEAEAAAAPPEPVADDLDFLSTL